MDDLWVELLGEDARGWTEAARWEGYDRAVAAWQRDMDSPSPKVQRDAEKRQALIEALGALRGRPARTAATPVVAQPAAQPAAGPLGAVTALTSRYSPPYVMLQWEWPPDIAVVRVCWTFEGAPRGPYEDRACGEDVHRSRYEAEGCFRVRSDVRVPHYFSLFPKPRADADTFGPRAEVVEPTGTVDDVAYEVVVKHRFLRRGRPERVFLRVHARGRGVPDVLQDLALVGRAGAVPVDLRGGAPVLDPLTVYFPPQTRVAEVDVPESFWNRDFYVRLFFKKPPATPARPIRLLPAAVERLRLGGP